MIYVEFTIRELTRAKHIPMSRSTLVWRMIWTRIPTWVVLRSYGIKGPSICVFCRNNTEEMYHIFVSCSFAAAVMSKIMNIFGVVVNGSFGFHHAFL